MKKDQTQLIPESQQVRNERRWKAESAAYLLIASLSVQLMDAGGNRTIPPDETSCFCLPTGYFPKCCRRGGTNNPKTVLLTALIILFIIWQISFLCWNCYDLIPPSSLEVRWMPKWNNRMRNHTIKICQTLPRLLSLLFLPIPEELSSSSQRRKPFQNRQILPEEALLKASKALLLRKKTPNPLLLDSSFFFRNHSLYQISSKGLGEMEERPLKQLKVALDTCFCKTRRTQASFRHWMGSSGSTLQHWGRRELRQVSMSMLSPKKDATRCYPTSKEAIYIETANTCHLLSHF